MDYTDRKITLNCIQRITCQTGELWHWIFFAYLQPSVCSFLFMVSSKSLIIVGYILFIRYKTEKGAKNKHISSAFHNSFLWLGGGMQHCDIKTEKDFRRCLRVLRQNPFILWHIQDCVYLNMYARHSNLLDNIGGQICLYSPVPIFSRHDL